MKEIIIAAPNDDENLKVWVNNCTVELQQDLLKYCSEMTTARGQKEKKHIVQLLLKSLPVLKTEENTEKFLSDTLDKPHHYNMKLWNRLKNFPLTSEEFTSLYLQVRDYQNCFMIRNKFASILTYLPTSPDHHLTPHRAPKK